MATRHDYARQARTYDRTRAASPSVLGPLRAALGAAPGRRLLDVGGGTGNYASALGGARLRGLIRRTGLDPGRFAAPEAGVGGPLVPLDSRVLDGAGFETALALTRRALADGERLRRTAATLPLARPIRAPARASAVTIWPVACVVRPPAMAAATTRRRGGSRSGSTRTWRSRAVSSFVIDGTRLTARPAATMFLAT